jgi:hypothetical protein
MIRWMLAGVRHETDTLEEFYWHWGILHAALLITQPVAMEVFERYVQNYPIPGVRDDELIHPLRPGGYTGIADHWLAGLDELNQFGHDPYYHARMGNHMFSQPGRLWMQLTGGRETLFDGDGSPQVKLFHFLAKREDLSHEEFAAAWRDEHAPIFGDAMGPSGPVRRYAQSLGLPPDSSAFDGTFLAPGGGVGACAGIEEIWFDSLDDLSRLRLDSALYESIRASEERFLDLDRTYSFVLYERVVVDVVNGGPRAAVLDPTSLEASIVAQGAQPWQPAIDLGRAPSSVAS